MLTITEALAEMKTIHKRVEKKKEFIVANLVRQDKLKDPLEKDGGSEVVIGREIQAIGDLWQRLVTLRAAVNRANLNNSITIDGATRTVADWLTWKREISAHAKTLWDTMINQINSVKQQAAQKGLRVTTSGTLAETPDDVIVALNLSKIAAEREGLENILGTLDGQLSLKNATITLEV